MILMVLMGLTKMDAYHIGLLFFFVYYMVAPNRFNNRIVVLVIYASFFLLEKYLATLIW